MLLVLGLNGCSTNGQRIDLMAAAAGLHKQIVSGTEHAHVIYEKAGTKVPDSGRLLVFLEGDGMPWGSSGMQPAADPTTRQPLALRLMLQTDAQAIYVVRPCYQGLVDAQCSTQRWTGGRYSEAVVGSMAAAIAHESRKLGASELILIGYSGGGVLAVLIAERLAQVRAVVTIAANLDIAAWARHHHYLPLDLSLNPAQSDKPHVWPEFHFSGQADTVVPAPTADEYFLRYPQARRLVIANANHVCCWESEWPILLARVQSELD